MKNAVDCNVVNLRLDNLNNENPKNGKNKENLYPKLSAMSVENIFRNEKINYNFDSIKTKGAFGRTTYFFYNKKDLQNEMIPIQQFKNHRLNSMKPNGNCIKSKSNNDIFSSCKTIYTSKNKKVILP